jgi:hypothetical protein
MLTHTHTRTHTSSRRRNLLSSSASVFLSVWTCARMVDGRCQLLLKKGLLWCTRILYHLE